MAMDPQYVVDKSDAQRDEDSSEIKGGDHFSDNDLATFHERDAGRLILDPEEARLEFGEAFSSRLKLTKDGKTILWPQPRDDPADPQNWSSRKKAIHIIIVTLATIVPDFDSAIGIATVFQLAKEYHTTTGHINNLTSKFVAATFAWQEVTSRTQKTKVDILVLRMGRPSSYETSATDAHATLWAIIRSLLVSTFGSRLSSGCYLCSNFGDICRYALLDRVLRIGIWTGAAILGPKLPTFLFSFLVESVNYRWAWGIGCIYGAVVLVLIVLFMEETMYDRTRGVSMVKPGFKGRAEALLGAIAPRIAKTAPSWKEVIMAPLALMWRPHFIGVWLFEAAIFGFNIGLNVTNTIFFQSPPPFGFGFKPHTVAGIYATPV
ncbi:hypothetical protein V5O48_013549, partial [Marasmius crinis-equi]